MTSDMLHCSQMGLAICVNLQAAGAFSSPSLQCNVCPYLTFAQARPVRLPATQFLFLSEAVHCILLLLSFFMALAACCFANIENKELSFPTSLRFLLPPSGSFRTLCFISIFTCMSCKSQPAFSKSQPAFSKSQPANTKVSRPLSGQRG
jgi:hypothetical protein